MRCGQYRRVSNIIIIASAGRRGAATLRTTVGRAPTAAGLLRRSSVSPSVRPSLRRRAPVRDLSARDATDAANGKSRARSRRPRCPVPPADRAVAIPIARAVVLIARRAGPTRHDRPVRRKWVSIRVFRWVMIERRLETRADITLFLP